MQDRSLSFPPAAIKIRGVREAPLRKLQGLFGHCQNGEGGLNACQDGLGHPYIWVKMREEVPQGARLSEGAMPE